MNMDVTIVGGGAAGLLTATHLLRLARPGLRIALVEKAAQIGNGIAYSTRQPEHLLNVIASRMSAFDDDPEHFVRYLQAHAQDESIEAGDVGAVFARRRLYSDYLRETFDAARAVSAVNIEILCDEVIAIDGSHARATLNSRSGGTLNSSFVVLALGNWPRTNSLPLSTGVPAGRVLQGWNFPAVADIGRDEEVVIAGSGLSMVDTALTLASNGHTARVHVVSRHALLPLPHAAHGHLDIDLDELARMPLRQRIRLLRQHARAAQRLGKPWQWLMDTLRTHNADLWQTLGVTDQQRFLRGVSRYWDVHRHRIAPSVAAIVDAMRTHGQMHTHRGRVGQVDWRDGRLQIQVSASADKSDDMISADRLIDCTGLQGDIRRITDPLINSLLERRMIRPGAHGIGIDTDMHGTIVAQDGQADARLYTLGSARIGQLWESVAVPELRLQAAALARRIDEQMRAWRASPELRDTA